MMGKRDDHYQRTSQVEQDKKFFSLELPDEEKGKPLKQGLGS